MISGTVAAGNALLWYEEQGAGSPVLVLHGFTGSIGAMAPIVDRLAVTHRVVAVDLIGHGRSSVPSSAADCTMAAVVGHVSRVVAAREAAPVHLVGYSMGGRVALSYAVAHPGDVASVVAIGASPGIEDDVEREERRAADEALAIRLENEGIATFVARWEAQPLLRPASTAGERAAPGMRELRLRNDPRALALVLRGLGPGAMPPLHASLRRLSVPVLLVAGAADERYRDAARVLAGVMPDARAAVIPDAGHAVHLDNPDELAFAVLPFLASVDRGAVAS